MTKDILTADKILDKAIELAQQSSWESFSLTELALLLDCSLNDIKQFYRSKDDIAESLFNRADDAMLRLATDEEYRSLSSDERLLECIMLWYEILAPYKAIVREMLGYKLEPGHFHLQAHGITRISRTVQWFLEVSDRRSKGIKRIMEEVAVTSAYLASFSYFLFDKSEQHIRTRTLLNKLIKKISQGEQLLSSSSITKQASSRNENSSEIK